MCDQTSKQHCGTKGLNLRHWTKAKLNTYPDGLADPEKCFAAMLDKLALKKLSKNEVLEHIQNHLYWRWKQDFQKEMLSTLKGMQQN